MKHSILLLSVCAAAAWPAFADQITLKNGDRISGSIVKSDTKNLVLKSEFAGTVTISWDAITVVTATDAVYVGLKDGQIVVGPVETAGANLTIRTQTTGTVSAAKDSVQFIRDKDEETAFEKEADRLKNPRLIDLWAGTLDLGFAAAQGNSKTESLTLSANANRSTTRDKITVNYTSLFASSDITGKSTTTANSKRGGIGYDLNLNPREFVFGSVDLESDQFQSLDLRFTPAGGAGYHAIHTDPTQLDLMLGASANREFFSTGLNRTSAEVLLGEELTHKFSATSSIHEKLVFFPNMSYTGQYRFNFDINWVTAVRKWFSWQVNISDRFLSNPVQGRKTNDVVYSTGARLVFAK
jgi:putative salt-induced outer membrane protein YdiY